MTVDAIPHPQNPQLQQAAKNLGLDFSELHGMTFGYGIYLTEGHRTKALTSHELRHVQQCEEIGSLDDFIREYVAQLYEYGYYDSPLESDARNHEL